MMRKFRGGFWCARCDGGRIPRRKEPPLSNGLLHYPKCSVTARFSGCRTVLLPCASGNGRVRRPVPLNSRTRVARWDQSIGVLFKRMPARMAYFSGKVTVSKRCLSKERRKRRTESPASPAKWAGEALAFLTIVITIRGSKRTLRLLILES